MNNCLLEQVAAAYESRFGCAPQHVVRAPGRVNLIGEHTDYNGGFVLPMAIDRATWIALGPRPDLRVRLHSLDYEECAAFDLERLHKCHASWVEYPKGVAWALQEAGFQLHGWDGVTKCDVPMGAGLSSSAAFELAVARAFAAVAGLSEAGSPAVAGSPIASGFEWDAARMALLCQKAENQWVGVQCGIMDQMISALGKEGHAVLIDCQDLSAEPVPLPSGEVVVIMDTMTRRDLADSAYNERRAQCEATAMAFGVATLRDLSMSDFLSRSGDLDPVVQRRVRHVISEIERTREAAEAMKRGDSIKLGKLMNESHDSLRDDFEVSNTQLNAIVNAARKTQGCFGARMTGGGFGGCAIALVSAELANPFVEKVTADYQRETGLDPKIYICEAAAGASVATIAPQVLEPSASIP